MATTIVVGNVKGGVGKSTTAVQLALHAGRRLGRVVLVDADPGRSALSWATQAKGWPHDRVPVVSHVTPDLPRRLRGLTAGADLVVIDTPHDPNEGTQGGRMLASAIAVADVVVVPTSIADGDLDRLPDMFAAIAAEEDRREVAWHLALVKVDLRRREEANELRAEMLAESAPVLASMVPYRVAIERAFGTADLMPWYEPLAVEVLDLALGAGVA